MEIVIIILCSLLLLFNIYILVTLKKKKEEPISSKEQEALFEVKKKLDDLENEMKKEMHATIQEEIIRMQGEFMKQTTSQRSGLEDFERNIIRQMEERFHNLNETMIQRISEINKKVNESIQGGFEGTSKAYQDLTKQLTLIEDARKQIDGLSTEVVSLRSVLENNQNRGKFGEFTLERILFSIFGDAKRGVYAFQYPLKDGMEINDRPDAVIFVPEPNKIICIDSKFPFQDYRRIIESEDEKERENAKKGFATAIKKHITDVKNKYIIKDKTAPEALLFIPSDALFGYIHGELDSVVDYARESHVILTSPSTLQPILATIQLVRLQYERNQNIEVVSKALQQLGKDFGKFAEDWRKFSEGINQLQTKKDVFDKRVGTIQGRFERIENNPSFLAIDEENKEKES